MGQPKARADEPQILIIHRVSRIVESTSLVPRPHPLRGEGSAEKRQDPWIMTSFCNVINNYYNYEIDRTRHERDTEA